MAPPGARGGRGQHNHAPREAAGLPEHVAYAMRTWAEDGDVAELCDANGISRDEFVRRRHQVETVDLFMTSVRSVRCVEWFPNLVTLRLVHQDLSRIEGLEGLRCLEGLWLNENRIERIEGLHGCTRLRELYLHSNCISRIEGLSRLHRLETLWLHDNQIAEIAGLDQLRALRVLGLAQNDIQRIGRALVPNAALEELNLAANRIGSFREVPLLAALPRLRSLCLSDPLYGSNPICTLCNYQTFTLFHLCSLTLLDYCAVTDESRQVAEATFVKKKMYYNMRIKTMRRNASSLARAASQLRQARLSEVHLSLNVLIRMARELERELAEDRHLPPPPAGSAPPPAPAAVEEKLRSVRHAAAARRAEIDDLGDRYAAMRSAVDAAADHGISRLLIELQTGGNIRMEDGRGGDVWYQSCVDLVRSRFVPADFAPFGIVDVRLARVTRIHNRHLRSRFEERLAQHVDTSQSSHKRALEYLFFGEDPDVPGEVAAAVEDGFGTSRDLERDGRDAGVPLANSVFLSEQARLLRLHERGMLPLPTDGCAAAARRGALTGRLVIAKAFLGKCHAERDPAPPAVPSDERVPEMRQALKRIALKGAELDPEDMRAFAQPFLTFVGECDASAAADKEPCGVLSAAPIPRQRPKVGSMDALREWPRRRGGADL